MKIILTAMEGALATEWARFCGDFECVNNCRGSILDVECHAVVSPANSFGFMDGGLDMVYSRFFGWHVQHRLQELIREHHHGELIVGTSEIVETDHSSIPFLIAAPTMRVPMILKDTVNPYLAARAALLLIKHGSFRSGTLSGQKVGDAVSTVAFPGLGTGVGQVSPEICARQMRAAIEEVVLGKHSFPQSWAEAQASHQRLYRDRTTDLQFEN